MKNLILGALLLLSMLSCTDETCGVISGYVSTGNDICTNRYYFVINGMQIEVTRAEWFRYSIGDTYCL